MRTLSTLLIAAALCAGEATVTMPKPTDPTSPEAQAEAEASQLRARVSYLVGLNMKRSVDQAVSQGKLDQAEILRGLNEALAGTAAAVDPQEANGLFQRYQQSLQAEENKAAAGRKADNDVYLAEQAKKPGMMKTASGLMYEVVKRGPEGGKQPTATSKVKVNYTGKLRDGSVFDASEKHGGPASFGLDGVIPGWTEGVQLMHVGDSFRFTIPSELAYGENGPPGIGPNQVLIFDIDLLDVLSNPK
jgi:FKBP-type peptidyl-prolyl cis-trans isomerase